MMYLQTVAEFILPDPREAKVAEARVLLRLARGSPLIYVSDELRREALMDALDLILDVLEPG